MRVELFIALLGGLTFGLSGGLGLGISAGIGAGLSWLIIGLVVGLAYFGKAVVEHFLLRWVLQRENHSPFRLVSFLDVMTQRILLQRAGAHYQFVHRTMQEHIASLTDAEIHALLERRLRATPTS